jgi:hypothetical protein
MKMEDLVTLRTFSNVVDAEIALGHLSSNGIEASIKKDDSGGMRPHFQLTHGVDLVVRKKDAKRAEQVLNAMNV